MKNTIKAVWEFLCVVLLGAPMILVGYFGTYLVFGLITGHRLYLQWHMSDSNKTSP